MTALLIRGLNTAGDTAALGEKGRGGKVGTVLLVVFVVVLGNMVGGGTIVANGSDRPFDTMPARSVALVDWIKLGVELATTVPVLGGTTGLLKAWVVLADGDGAAPGVWVGAGLLVGLAPGVLAWLPLSDEQEAIAKLKIAANAMFKFLPIRRSQKAIGKSFLLKSTYWNLYQRWNLLPL
jgi:hypothetical protein